MCDDRTFFIVNFTTKKHLGGIFMLYPAIEQVKELFENYKTVPVFYELLMDSCTPIQLFNCLHEAYDDCFILESVDNKDQWGKIGRAHV